MNDKTIKALIIDDEDDARDILERVLLRLENIDIIGKTSTADEGFEMILKLKPDIAFLDIQMPGKDGFMLVRQLKSFNIKTTVIFVTAHVEYAIEALKVAAFDYLLKPVEFTDLKTTIQRFREEKLNEMNEQKVDILLDMLNKKDKISFNTRTGYIYVKPEDIVYCEADVNYTTIYFGGSRKEVVTINIGKMEEMLDKSRFYRISRSHLINLEYLVKADRKLKCCELYKNNEKFCIPAPPKQIRLLENRIH
jgi:two-component system LytT family response regulator